MALKEGAKLNITFKTKRITRSESKLVGLTFVLGALLIYCLVLTNLQT